ncbi:MAG: SDR family NAD(P)-dependent oxidoreductase [Planctomycetales bacterium]|nr:SDR family NAD(P)-dependent oxidoreductase [Planctomycetales bacterium]
MPYSWQNKVCVVTGASAGLGLAIARAFCARQARVVINARGEQQLAQAAASLTGSGAEVLPIAGDVTQQKDVDRLVQAVKDQFGRADLLCNCAGRSARQAVLDTTPADFQELLDVNFLATVRTTRAFASMVLEHKGSIVNVGSLASKVAPRFMGAYPASKYALAAYSQQLRLEHGSEGLHVLLVCPGPIRRGEANERYQQQSQSLPPAARRPGAGAKLRGIDPNQLADRIVSACERRKLELVVPAKVRLLLTLAQLSPRLGDWMLQRATSD